MVWSTKGLEVVAVENGTIAPCMVKVGARSFSLHWTSDLGPSLKHVETVRSAALLTFPSLAVSSSPSPAAMPVQSTP